MKNEGVGSDDHQVLIQLPHSVNFWFHEVGRKKNDLRPLKQLETTLLLSCAADIPQDHMAEEVTILSTAVWRASLVLEDKGTIFPHYFRQPTPASSLRIIPAQICWPNALPQISQDQDYENAFC